MLVLAALSWHRSVTRITATRAADYPLGPAPLFPVLALLGSVMWLASFEPQGAQPGANQLVGRRAVDNTPVPVRIAVAARRLLALAAAVGRHPPGRVRALPWNGESRLRYAALGRLRRPRLTALSWAKPAAPACHSGASAASCWASGDPAGAESDRISAIWRLRDLAQQEGRDAAVWRAGPALLEIYSDLGLTALPLGPDGMPVPGAKLAGPRPPHYLCCVAERDLHLLLPMLPALGAPESSRLRAGGAGWTLACRLLPSRRQLELRKSS